MNEDAYDQEEYVPRAAVGIKDRLRSFFGIGGVPVADEPEVVYEEPEPVRERIVSRSPLATTEVAPAMTPRNTTTFRVSPVREASIAILPASSFAHAQKAADRLKQGEAQIVNLEGTSPEIAARLIDFLNGVTYALGGAVERVSEGAYLFTPESVQINADKPEEQPKSPFDRV